MSPNVVVTGGAGFIGSHVVDAMLAEGYQVAVIDNLSTGSRENLNPRARFYEVDIRDAAAVQAVFEAEQPAVLFHQAAQADVRASLVDPVGYAETNILGTLNLLQAALATNTTPKFVFASTGGAVYGNPAELPATERCPTLPLDPYGTSKLACEYYLYTYKHNYGLDTVVLRYANVYGPRQNADGEAGVVAIFTKRLLKGQTAIINGDGEQTRDYVYVGDVVRANVEALSRGDGLSINIGTALETDVNVLFRKLRDLSGSRQEEIHGPGMPGEQRRSVIDNRLAYDELGWYHNMLLDDGLALTLAHFRDKLKNAIR